VSGSVRDDLAILDHLATILEVQRPRDIPLRNQDGRPPH
jgi:hypothetical protein